MTRWFRKPSSTKSARQSGGRPFRFIAAAICAVLVVFWAGASTAHAGPLDALISFSMKGIVEGLLILASTIVAFEGWFLTQLLSVFAVVTTWQMTANNTVVYDAWVIARDLVNLFFIVGLVVISFATIFRTLGFLQNYHWKTALPKLLIAAILVNLSLGISEVVVLTSNRVTVLFAGITQRYGANLGEILGADILLHAPLTMTDIEPASRNLGNIMGPPALSPDGTQWEHYLSFKQNRTAQEEASYNRCTTAPGETKRVPSFWLPVWAERQIRKSTSDCVRELAMARRGERDVSIWERRKVEVEASVTRLLEFTDEQEASQRLNLLFSSLFTIALLAMVIISIGCAVLFFLVRTVAIWILMFLSAFAFGFNWIGNGTLSKWWKQFFGWNMFGPFYMLVIIFGMMFLMRSGELMQSVSVGQGFQGLIQTFFLFLFAMIVFIGGLLLALNSSFAAAVKSTPVLGAAAQRVGAFSALTASRAFGARVIRATGVPAYAQARKEKLVQQYQRIRPEFLRMKTREEQVAAARRRLGVAGGAQEAVRLHSARVQEAQTRIDNSMNAQVIRNPGEATGAFLQRQNEFLHGQMRSLDRGQQLAARRMLIGRGQLDTDEIARTRIMTPRGLARAEFDRMVDESAVADPQQTVDYHMQGYATRTGNLPGTPLYNTELTQQEDRRYNSILANPQSITKLRPEYLTRGSNEYNTLERLVNQRWPTGTTQQNNARGRALQRFADAAENGQQSLAVQNLFA